ncbi:MAG: DUF4410 domain-containing protein [Terriglobales bacterium]
MRSLRMVPIVLMVLAALTAPADDKPAAAASLKGKYEALEVTQFTIKPGVGFPTDYLSKMNAELVLEIGEKKKFKIVYGAGNPPQQVPAARLRLEGEVTQFKPGSQAVRYFIGFGAGKTKVKAHVKFIDVATDQVVFEDDVDGKVIMGLLGGSSPGATRGLAKEVAKVAAKTFF